MSADDPVEDLALSILEGAEVDWERAEADAAASGGIGRIRALREVVRIVAFHRRLQRDGSVEDPPDAGGTGQ